MSNLKRKIKNIELGIPVKKKADLAYAGLQGMLAGEQGHTLGQWMADTWNHNFDAYDAAIDAVYNETHVGGSRYHHLLDGQHSLWGAFRAVEDVSLDDGWAQELAEASEHLIRDTASVSGINPFFSFSPEHFESIGTFLSSLGISKEYFADALTFNGPELLGGSLALVTALLLGKKAEPERLSYFSGGCLLSSLASANPVLLPIAAGSMAYAISKNKNKRKLMIQAGKGSLVSGGVLVASSVVGGPVWLGCVAGFMAALAVSKGMEKAEKAFLQSQKVIEPAQRISHRVLARLSEDRPQAS